VLDLTKDDLGRSVTPPAKATRVVAMSPTVVELMYAVGAVPVGRPSSADYPPEAKSVPGFGTSYQPNYEEIANMKPDLIIADAIIDKDLAEQLAKLGAPVFAVKVDSFNGVTRGLRLVGALTGNKDAGDAAAKKLDDKLASVKSKISGNGPSVIVLAAAGPGQFIASRDNSYLGDLLKLLGAKNVVTSGDPENFRFPGFSDYSPERIVEKNPDVVLALSLGGPPGTPKTSEALKSNAALSTINAVKQGRVFEVDPAPYLQSAGPRVSQVLDELPRLLYPNVFATTR
jgi:iron complex transport system substrate-binding protein